MPDDSIRDLAAEWKDDPAKVVRELRQRYENATTGRRNAWKRWRKIWRNEWYKSSEGSTTRYSANYVHSNVEELMGYVQAQPPTFSVTSRSVQAEATDTLLDGLVEHAMERMDFNSTLWSACRQAFTVGTCWLKVRFDPDLGVHGEPVVDAVPVESVMPDVWASDYGSMRFLLHRVPDADPATIAKMFKKDAEDIKPRDQTKKQSQAEIAGSPLPKADLIEAWVLVGGSWQVAWVSGEHVLKGPVKSPYDHGRLPFVPRWDIPPLEGVYGVGEGEMIEPLQDWADEIDMRIRKIAKKTANRRLLINEAVAGVTASAWDDESTAAVGVADATPDALRWVDQPPFPEALLTERDSVEQRIEKITGVSPNLMGTGGGANHRTSGVAAAVFAEQAQKRVESRLVTMRWSCQQIAYQVLRLQLQYYQEERLLRLKNGKVIHLYPDYPDALKQAWQGLDPRSLQMAKESWRAQNGVDLVLSDVRSDALDVEVETDTAVPQTKSAKANLAMALHKEGLLDQQAVLDSLEWPEREEIIARMQLAHQNAPPQPGAPQGAPVGLGAVARLQRGGAGPGMPPPQQPAVPAQGMVG